MGASVFCSLYDGHVFINCQGVTFPWAGGNMDQNIDIAVCFTKKMLLDLYRFHKNRTTSYRGGLWYSLAYMVDFITYVFRSPGNYYQTPGGTSGARGQSATIVCHNKIKPAVEQFRFSKEGIFKLELEGYTKIFTWFDIQKAYETEGYLYLYTGPGSALVIPKKELESQAVDFIKSLV